MASGAVSSADQPESRSPPSRVRRLTVRKVRWVAMLAYREPVEVRAATRVKLKKVSRIR
jgi:hypothetical protein